jgi:hypothetical protein
MVTGRFAHMRMSGETMVSTASAEEANISVLLLCVSAWHVARSPMLRSERRGMGPPDVACVCSTFIDPSIGRAL